MTLAVSLVMEFKYPVGSTEFYEKLKVVSQGLGLATPARAAVEHVGPNTISITKMVCSLPVYNRLMKLLRPEDAITQELLARYEINELFMLSRKPNSPKITQPYQNKFRSYQPPPSLEKTLYKPYAVEAPKVSPPRNPYAQSTSSTSTKQPTGSPSSNTIIPSTLSQSNKHTTTNVPSPNLQSAKSTPISTSSFVNNTSASAVPIESKLKVESNGAGAGTVAPVASSNNIPCQRKESNVPVNKRPTPDETEQNEHPSKRLRTAHNPGEGTGYLQSLLRENIAHFLAADERDMELRQSLRGKISELKTALAKQKQETSSVTQIEESKRVVSEIQTKLLNKEKELCSATQTINDVKARNKSLLQENNQKNEELQRLKDNERSTKEQIEDLQRKLDSERDLRQKAEKLIDDIRRELKFPFVVPSLLDAFAILSESSVQMIPPALSTDSE